MDDREVQPERRLGEARQLDAHHRSALGAPLGRRTGRLVGLKAVSPMGQPKKGHLRRVLVGTPAPGQASVLPRRHGAATPLPSAAVNHDFDPGGPDEASLERGIDPWPIHPRDNHPAGALWGHAALTLVAHAISSRNTKHTKHPWALPRDGRQVAVSSATV